MNIIFNEEVVEGVFIIGTIAVLAILWLGYYRNRYSSLFARLMTLVFVVYMFGFMWYRHLKGNVEEKFASEPSYALIASIHGIVSLLAILLAGYVFTVAERTFSQGENYFVLHKNLTLTLAILWPVALLSGFLLG